MILDKKDLYKRIKNYEFEINSDETYTSKLNNLEKAIMNSIEKVSTFDEINLTFSGGVDSCLLLYKIIDYFKGTKINVYTISSQIDCPDMIYSKNIVKELGGMENNLKHLTKLMKVSDKDTRESNRILGLKEEKADMYYMLMKFLSEKNVKEVVNGDVIDELMGGYYKHLNYPTKKIFKDLMSRLIPEHLEILDKISSYFDIDVYLPYGNQEVMKCASQFNISELINNGNKKQPIYDIAERNGIPRYILERRKYGLISALNSQSNEEAKQ